MHKRLSIRLVDELARELARISKKRGLSINALVSEIAWNFVETWNVRHKELKKNKTKP